MKYVIRKVIILIFILFISFTLTGCIQSIELTETESNVISEYMASTLLKYDKNYKSRFLTLEDIKKEDEIKEDFEEIKIEDISESLENKDNNEVNHNIEENKKKYLENFNNLFTKMINIEGLTISINKYEIIDSYEKGDKKMIASMQSRKTTNYVKFEFNINNTTDKEIKLDLLNNKIFYRLNIDDIYYNFLLTIFPEDIVTFNSYIPAKSKINSVLFFEVPKDFNKDNMILEIIKENNTFKFKCLILK